MHRTTQAGLLREVFTLLAACSMPSAKEKGFPVYPPETMVEVREIIKRLWMLAAITGEPKRPELDLEFKAFLARLPGP